MKLVLRSVLATLVVFTVACAAPAPPPPPDTTAADTAAITKLRDTYTAAWKAGDAAQLASLWTEDAVAYPPDAPALTGRAAVLADITAFFGANTPNDYTVTSAEMKVAGDWAYDRGTTDIAFTPKVKGAKMVTMQTRYIVIVRRDTGGAWRLASGIDNTATPMPAPAPMPTTKK
jgi:uncharacterized protein (TIGR02246 family)